MKIRILTSVWGPKHIDMFKKACLTSLGFEKNAAALYEAKAEWTIFTEDKDFDQIRSMVTHHLPHIKLDLRSKRELRRRIDPLQEAIIMMIEWCMMDGSKLLMAPPDTIFGDGTIAGLIACGREKDACVVVPHPRVLPEILNESLEEHALSAKMVTLAWKYLHKAWSDAEVGHHTQNSFVGGVSWKKIDEKTFAVTHRLPTVYLASFTNDDLQFFKNCISFGDFDHTWPSMLVNQGRQRFVGSSDACFIVEITEKDKNVPPIWPGDPDDFWRKNPHNEQNKQILAIFRGE